MRNYKPIFLNNIPGLVHEREVFFSFLLKLTVILFYLLIYYSFLFVYKEFYSLILCKDASVSRMAFEFICF